MKISIVRLLREMLLVGVFWVFPVTAMATANQDTDDTDTPSKDTKELVVAWGSSSFPQENDCRCETNEPKTPACKKECGHLKNWWGLLNRKSEFADWNHFPRFLAEPRAAVMKVDLVEMLPGPQYTYANPSKYRPMLDISAGWQIPIWGRDSDPYHMLADGHGVAFGVFFPISFHTLFDFADAEASNPIVNTDYRFAVGDFRLAIGLKKTKRAGHSIAFRCSPVSHESTHVGDEYIIAAQAKAIEENFLRVNVSKWVTEFAVQYMVRFRDGHGLRVGAGMELVYSGPYTVSAESSRNVSEHSEPIDHPVIETGKVRLHDPDKKNLFHLDFEYFLSKRLTKSTKFRSNGFLISTDLRIRPKHNFVPNDLPDPKEKMTTTFNVVVGYLLGQHMENQGMGNIFLGLRYYAGINPHGQFRTGEPIHIFGLTTSYFP